jgi:hypothetical protein
MSSDPNWSLGVLMFALVALHLSSHAGLAAPKSKGDSIQLLRHAVSGVADRLKKDPLELARQIYSSQSLDVACDETGTEMLLLKFEHSPSCSEEDERRLRQCFKELDEKIGKELNSLSNSVRQTFELFSDKNPPNFTAFRKLDSAIRALRNLVAYKTSDSDDESKKEEVGQNYLRSCEEVNEKFARLKPVVTNCNRDAIRLTNNLNSISFYQFCHQLITGKPHDADSVFLLYNWVTKFLESLDDQGSDGALESASDGGKEQSVVATALQVAKQIELESKKVSRDLSLEKILSTISKQCSWALSRAENESWFLEISQLAQLGVWAYAVDLEDERYYRYKEACEILVRNHKMTTEMIDEEYAMRRRDAEKRCKASAKQGGKLNLMGCFGKKS